MGILDSIKGIGNSVGLVSSICNKSWLQIDDSGERTTYVFKPNNQLHLTKNGVCQIVSWKYFPENERLVIYYMKDVGRSFCYSFVEKGVLLTLKADQTGEIIILANERAANSPKSVAELGVFFMKKNATIVSSVIGSKESSPEYFERIAQTLDKVLDGCDNDMLIEHINYFRKNVPGFDTYYHKYINYKKYLQDFPKKNYDDAYLDALSYFQDAERESWISKIIPPVNFSHYLDSYLACVGERIEYDGITKRIIEMEKKKEDYNEQWGR